MKFICPGSPVLAMDKVTEGKAAAIRRRRPAKMQKKTEKQSVNLPWEVSHESAAVKKSHVGKSNCSQVSVDSAMHKSNDSQSVVHSQSLCLPLDCMPC